jgi:rubrerythrin
MDKQLSEVLDMAIQREVEAFDFYMDIYGRVEDQSARDTLEFIAGEEKKHKAFLEKYREGGYGPDALRMADVVEYKIAEYLQEPEVQTEMSSQDVYLVASHRENRSHRFYTELAGMHNEGDIKTMLLKMANEELKHKEKMEYLYSNTAFPQTSGG